MKNDKTEKKTKKQKNRRPSFKKKGNRIHGEKMGGDGGGGGGDGDSSFSLSLSLSLSLSKMATELFVRLGHVVGKMKLPLPVRIVDLSLK